MTASVYLFPFCSKTNEWTTIPNFLVWWDFSEDPGFLHHFKSSDSWNCQKTEHLLRPCYRTLRSQIILPDFGTYNESSIAQNLFILSERDRHLQKSSLDELTIRAYFPVLLTKETKGAYNYVLYY